MNKENKTIYCETCGSVMIFESKWIEKQHDMFEGTTDEEYERYVCPKRRWFHKFKHNPVLKVKEGFFFEPFVG